MNYRCLKVFITVGFPYSLPLWTAILFEVPNYKTANFSQRLQKYSIHKNAFPFRRPLGSHIDMT